MNRQVYYSDSAVVAMETKINSAQEDDDDDDDDEEKGPPTTTLKAQPRRYIGLGNLMGVRKDHEQTKAEFGPDFLRNSSAFAPINYGAHARGVLADSNIQQVGVESPGVWLTSSCPHFFVAEGDPIPRTCTRNAQHYHCLSFDGNKDTLVFTAIPEGEAEADPLSPTAADQPEPVFELESEHGSTEPHHLQ
jgi:hypothetical protein